MRVNFFLKDKKKNQTSIEAIIRFRGERFKLSTGLSLESRFWNPDEHRCRNVREYPESRIINSRLEQFEVKLKSIFSDYELKDIVPTKVMFNNDFTGEEKERSFLTDIVKSHVDKSHYDIETKKKYITTLHWIEAYEKKNRTKLTTSDIDLEWYNHFKRWFNSQTYEKKVRDVVEIRHYSLNYFGSIIKCLKVVLKGAGKEFDVPGDVSDRQFKTEAEESDSVYLSESELKKIIDFIPSMENIIQFTKEARLHNLERTIGIISNVKSRFLIGCYTALRVSDFKRIDLVNVKDGFIRIKPKKGVKKNVDVIIPIHPVVRSILDSGFDLEKKMYEQDINQWIKEICRVVGIDEMISITRTEGGKQIERVYPKWQLVTTHTARRSGATNMFKAGIPSISIMKITGHRTEKSFLKYIKISAEENAEMLAKHSFFN
jgi:integrase